MSSLSQLELLIQQLFSGGATSQQMQEIHQALESFSQQKGAWKDALYFLSHTTNQQTAMYSLTVLEVCCILRLYHFGWPPFSQLLLIFLYRDSSPEDGVA